MSHHKPTCPRCGILLRNGALVTWAEHLRRCNDQIARPVTFELVRPDGR